MERLCDVRWVYAVDRIYPSSEFDSRDWLLLSSQLMPCLLAWGNNLAGNLDPASGEPIISSPRRVLEDLGIEEIVWSSWASTIGRGMSLPGFSGCEIDLWSVGDEYYTWGSAIPGELGQAPAKLSLASRPVKILGADEATVYLDQDGHVRKLPDDGAKSSTSWEDVVLLDSGAVYAISADTKSTAQVSHFKTFDDFMIYADSTTITHPLLNTVSSLHATESRVFALSSGPLVHLLEIDSKGSVKLVEDLEGLGVESIVPGSANRIAVVTEAGDAYLIHNRSLEPELLEVEDESAVRFVGVGSKHEIVVTEDNVWVRGESKSLILCVLTPRQVLSAGYGNRSSRRLCKVTLL